MKAENGYNAADIISNGVRGKADINAIASKDENAISVLVWNYHDENTTGPVTPVSLTIDGVGSKKVLVHHYRVDERFSNSFEKWKAMGRPQNVTAKQYEELEKAGQLQLFASPEWKTTNNGKTVLEFQLPRQGVLFFQLSW